MEKLCIVKRRSRIADEDDSTAMIVSQEDQTIQEQDFQAISQIPQKNSSGINVHDADTLIFKEVTGEEEQIFSIELTPQQAKVVQSMNCIRDLLSGKHHGVKMSMEKTEDGKTAFNFHFKPVYTTRMLNAQDVAIMLQISKSMLYKLVKDKELKSYKVGKLRRFLLEDVVGYLSGSYGSEIGI
ncbi:MAG TPA: helix-turn-helix domain-containing protein [Syntrophorhabdaceae bacterium]|nr:helix-turn-helix domain-containing protein [Syntrophorhabdaceae bacterium]